MMKGKLIAIEGTDGSGKTVQFELLKKRLEDRGIDFKTLDLPRYDEPSSYFIKRYLRGEYGSINALDPKVVSLFYALDRFDISGNLKKWLDSGDYIISNRYIASNMAHQGSKFSSKKKRKEFLNWLENMEYEICGVPKPDLNIILHVPAEIAQKLGDRKKSGRRTYVGGKRRDIHEEDLNHLKKTEKIYLELAEAGRDDFVVIKCVKDGEILSKGEIHEKVWKVVSEIL